MPQAVDLGRHYNIYVAPLHNLLLTITIIFSHYRIYQKRMDTIFTWLNAAATITLVSTRLPLLQITATSSTSSLY